MLAIGSLFPIANNLLFIISQPWGGGGGGGPSIIHWQVRVGAVATLETAILVPCPQSFMIYYTALPLSGNRFEGYSYPAVPVPNLFIILLLICWVGTGTRYN